MCLNLKCVFLVIGLTVCCLTGPINAEAPLSSLQPGLSGVLKKAKRIPTSDGWFEVIKLPNNIYAFHEPGHMEKVNSFLIIGEKKDLLYDTGMGVASIKHAIVEVRKAEGLPEREIMVLNSHGHLDHIGGNHEFDTIYAYEHEWRTRKLTEGIPAGNATWVGYYQALTPLPHPPQGFSPDTMSVRPVDKDKIRYLHNGDVIDLGNRQFKVIISLSHTQDSVILYDAESKLLFTGDVFVPAGFYVMDLEELYKDLRMLSGLEVAYHYNTHGPQLIDLQLRSEVLRAAEKIKANEVVVTTVEFLGEDRQVYHVDAFSFWYMPDFLMY
jgi:glyoxylase-like metal-dependent hydrolase (beta-lactamase superfamily II)